MLSNQHYPHRANQKLRSWANAVFQNRGVCGQAVPSFPSPSPVIHFFCSCPSFLDEPREETLATQAIYCAKYNNNNNNNNNDDDDDDDDDDYNYNN